MKKMVFAVLIATLAMPTYGANPTLTSIAANTAFDLGGVTSAPIGNVCGGMPLAYTRFTYVQPLNKLLLFGGGHGTTPRTDVISYNLGTLTWANEYASTTVAAMTTANLDTADGKWIGTGQPVSRHTYDLMPYAPNTGDLILLGGQQGNPSCLSTAISTFYFATKIAHYNPVTKIWRFSTEVDLNYKSAEYDPVSGKIVVVGESGMWTYDPVSMVKTKVKSFYNDALSITKSLVYYPPTDKMYYFVTGATTRVWEVTLDRFNWAASAIIEVTGIAGDLTNTGRSAFAYDSVNQVIGGAVRQIVKCQTLDTVTGLMKYRTAESRFDCGGWTITDRYSHISIFNPVAKTWDKVRMATSNTRYVGSLGEHYTLDYDTDDGVFMMVTGDVGDYSDKRLWAYKYR